LIPFWSGSSLEHRRAAECISLFVPLQIVRWAVSGAPCTSHLLERIPRWGRPWKGYTVCYTMISWKLSVIFGPSIDIRVWFYWSDQFASNGQKVWHLHGL